MRVLIANRGDVAVRVCRAAAALDVPVVAVHTAEDAGRPHTRLAEESIPLPGNGIAGYLDIEAVIAAAVRSHCTHIHPGWGFLSESAEFARACAAAGLGFIGPDPELLALFGDKTRARERARSAGVPVLAAAPAADAAAFLAEQPAGVMVKAVAGGGGRGMRAVTDPAELTGALTVCRAEALAAFGDGELYVERLLPSAKHVEVQVVGDGTAVVALGERECSVQRRHQKLIEVAPSPALDDGQRAELSGYAIRLIGATGYRGLATVEFLLDAANPADGPWFIEVNPRLQVEHPVTEEVTGVDLVVAQLRLADGAGLADLGLTPDAVPAPAGFAIQCRVVALRPGPLTGFRPPTGPGVRVDTDAEPGQVVDGAFDPLLAKVITHGRHGGFAAVAAQAARALAELAVTGVPVNTAELRAVLAHPEFVAGRATTALLSDAVPSDALLSDVDVAVEPVVAGGVVAAPVPGTVVSVEVAVGDAVTARTPVVVVEAMKMHHAVPAGSAGTVTAVAVAAGEQVAEGAVLLRLDPAEDPGAVADEAGPVDVEEIRPDLADLRERHARTRDEARPAAVARRHGTGHRTIRENLADLVDPDSLTEYGALAVAAQRRRRDVADLVASTPADGIVTGVGRVDGGACAVLGYDYTVLAGTQGFFGHRKADRMLAVAERRGLPVVLFAEGGGGRPGDVDVHDIASSWLDCATFAAMGRLSGRVPTVGVLTGRCFAGNAALLGCCDVVIATEDSTLGMAGPAMIEGGGLGRVAAEDVGPMSVQVPNGVVDVLVADDAAAVDVARRYLSYFRGPRTGWECADQRLLRHLIPEDRLRVYDVRRVVAGIADTDSVLELRSGFGAGVVTALVRVAGRPLGVVANNPAHLGGAIDADAADKMARFLQLCDAHGLPVLSLCDTPGFMVGPEAERTATVRHFSRLFVIGAHLRVPMLTVVLRKGYGLGAQAMAAGHFRATLATVAWPTGEVGAMGLEGAVRLGYAKELADLPPEARHARYEELVARHYAAGKAVNAAMVFELDDVIDPADTRPWITETLTPHHPPKTHPTPYIDPW